MVHAVSRAIVTPLGATLSTDQRVAYLLKLCAVDVRADVFVDRARTLGFTVSWDMACGTPVLRDVWRRLHMVGDFDAAMRRPALRAVIEAVALTANEHPDAAR